MRLTTRICCGLALALLAAGCKSSGNKPLAALSSIGPWKSQASRPSNEQLELAQANRELQSRLNSLNANDEQLHKLLAESQQETNLYKAENEALRDQLRSATAYLQRTQAQSSDTQRKYENLLASSRRRGGAILEPNNSLRDHLPLIEIPGVEVRRDGDLVRVDILAARLFTADDAQISPEGGKLLEAVVDELDRRYPGNRIGVEGHTDNQPLRSARWSNHHQFSLARANAVFNYLSNYTRLRTQQLTVSAYGGTRPFASNAQPAGRERNHRIELVVYPERVGN
jgi:flagellar motor protein MotB